MPGKKRITTGKQSQAGFTLAEIVITILVLAILLEGLISGYIFSARRAEWSAHSLAAHSLAIQALEQSRASTWNLFSGVDNMPPTNYTRVEMLDLPVAGGQPQYATNFIQVTTVSANPPLREIRADCVWVFHGRGARLYTNSVITCRAPDQ